MNPPVLRALLFTSDQASAKGELTEVGNTIRFQAVGGDVGSGSLFVGRDDPSLDAASSRPEIGDIVRIDVDTTPAFPWVIERITYRDLAERGKADEGWHLQGRGTLCVFDKAVVWPPLGVGRALFSETRVWNFASPELDETEWGAAVATEFAHTGVNFGLVELFPDTLAEWIWDREVAGGIPGDSAPEGDCYFRTTFAKTAFGSVELWAAADDSFEVWIDGVQVLTDPGYYRGNVRRTKPFGLDAGDHKIAIRGTNQNAAKAGILATVLEVDSAGVYGDVICRTDETWLCASYPTIDPLDPGSDPKPPGFRPTQILRILLAEWVARGGGDGVAVSFEDFEDTAGTPVEEIPEFSCRIGSTYYSVIRQMQELYLDLRMQATALTLDGWLKGDAGTSKPITFDNPTGDPDVDNIRTLTHEITNVGQVQP